MAANSATALKNEGNRLLKSGDLDGAIEQYTKAIEMEPEGGTTHLFYSNRSSAYAKKKDFNNALADANKCMELQPDFIKGYWRKANALFGLGETDAAIDIYRAGFRALKLNAKGNAVAGNSDKNLSEQIAALKQQNTDLMQCQEDYLALLEDQDEFFTWCGRVARDFDGDKPRSFADVQMLIEMLRSAVLLGPDGLNGSTPDGSEIEDRMKTMEEEFDTNMAILQTHCQTLNDQNKLLRDEIAKLREDNKHLENALMSSSTSNPSEEENVSIPPHIEPSVLIPIDSTQTKQPRPPRKTEDKCIRLMRELEEKKKTIEYLESEVEKLMQESQEGKPSEQKMEDQVTLISESTCDELRRRLFIVWFDSTFDSNEWATYLPRFVEHGLDDVFFWMSLVQFESEHSSSSGAHHPYTFSVDMLLRSSEWIGIRTKRLRDLFVEKVNGKTVYSFLRSVGLIEHADKFRAGFMTPRTESIQELRLSSITEERLKANGVDKPGHRVRILWGLFLRQFEGGVAGQMN